MLEDELDNVAEVRVLPSKETAGTNHGEKERTRRVMITTPLPSQQLLILPYGIRSLQVYKPAVLDVAGMIFADVCSIAAEDVDDLEVLSEHLRVLVIFPGNVHNGWAQEVVGCIHYSSILLCCCC